MDNIQTHPELEALGFKNLSRVYWQLHATQLDEEAVSRNQAHIAQAGPLVVRTGEHTGRSPKDRYVVKEPSSDSNIAWGEVNRPMSEAQFDSLLGKVLAYFQGKEAYVE